MPKLILLFMWGFNFLGLAKCDFFSSLADMEELLHTESVLLHDLNNFIKAQEQRLLFLESKLITSKRAHVKAKDDISGYLGNPINAFLLIKRLTVDWENVEAVIKNISGPRFLANKNFRNKLTFPSDDDLSGASLALIRIQDTYDLDVSCMAKGQLNGVQYRSEMSSYDCFEVGRQAYNIGDAFHTITWMQEALFRLNNTADTDRAYHLARISVISYLAFSTYELGYLFTALSLTNELLEMRPDFEDALMAKGYIEGELTECVAEDVTDFQISNLVNFTIFEQYKPDDEVDNSYELLCRGKLQPPASQIKELRCRYVSNDVPFLQIGPLKMEEMCKDPFIVVYHDAMYDKEIEMVKEIARPKLQRAQVVSSLHGRPETSSYRVCKSAWIDNRRYHTINKISQRVEDMTGLDMEFGSDLQVVNYGIGGYYGPHFDFQVPVEKDMAKEIATVLFYLNNVKQGGATVFPIINVAVQPKKGTALVWYNLHRSGEGDFRTRHAACPVLYGSKWVSNKWIYEEGQEFRRPCALEPDHRL